MGHIRSRFSSHLSANTPVHPQKISRKSFPRRILPITLTRSVFCAQNLPIPMKTRNFSGEGEGGTHPTTSSQTGNPPKVKSDQPVAKSGPYPSVYNGVL